MSLEGDFIWSITYTDIFSGWTSLRAVWNKGAHGIVEVTREVEAALPFVIEGFDCNNDSEFLSWYLVCYFQERLKKVSFTRSRPYHKNDPAGAGATSSKRTGPMCASCSATNGWQIPRWSKRSTRFTVSYWSR